MISAYLSLAKPRILGLILVSSLASALVAGEGTVTAEAGLFLVLSGGLASAGAAYLNNYFDRDIDTLMVRTKGRPLPLGRVRPRIVLITGLVLIAAAIPAALRLNYAVATFILGGAFVYSVVYTLWLKRRTSLNIVIGGLSGSCAVLAGWFAMTSAISAVPFLIALIVFMWTPGHFWSLALAHRDSYRRAGVPMLPAIAGTKKTIACIVASTGLLVASSLLPGYAGGFGMTYAVAAIVLGVMALTLALVLLFRPTRRLAWLNFKFSGVYLLGLLVAMVVGVVTL
ncbi:MAG: protoheme IX farnesyltransferase [Chloroflexi bacterium RBG_16_57_8]|nr:MAG: protoheme IX farnesyltransferase [Chloroflexi bacterium RBG_16_57_8]